MLRSAATWRTMKSESSPRHLNSLANRMNGYSATTLLPIRGSKVQKPSTFLGAKEGWPAPPGDSSMCSWVCFGSFKLESVCISLECKMKETGKPPGP